MSIELALVLAEARKATSSQSTRRQEKSELILVDAEMAKKLLSCNYEKNRNIRRNVVNKYKKLLIEKKFLLTHQGVALTKTGRLIDGQHRLMAIIETGIPALLFITTGLSEEAYKATDRGHSRKLTDILRYEGREPTNEEIAISKMMAANGRPHQILSSLEDYEYVVIVDKFIAATDFIKQNMPKRVAGVTVAPVLAAVGAAFFYEKNKDRLRLFLHTLGSGLVDDPQTDSSAILLRDHAVKNIGKNQANFRTALYLRSQRAVKAFMDREALSKLYQPETPIYDTSAIIKVAENYDLSMH